MCSIYPNNPKGVCCIRFAITAVLVAGLFLVMATGATNESEPATKKYWQLNGCDHGYSVKQSKQGIQHSTSWKQARKFWRCARTRPRAVQLHGYWIGWKNSYSGYWQIQALRNPGVHARLRRLRYCESRNNYKIDSHHDGAYQYDSATWNYAQNMYGVPGSKRTSYAYQASVEHQDVVTGVLFPREPSRWAASQHCWG